MIPKRRPKIRMNVRPPERARSPGHLAWVRGHECAASTVLCAGKTQAHHVRVEGDGTTGLKPGDDKAVPLCQHHHERGHAIGWKAFEARYRVDLTAMAKTLWRLSRHRRAWERKAAEHV